MNTKTITAIQKASEIVGGKSALARLVGVRPPTVQQWANGSRPVAPDRCIDIERVTGGAVTRSDLRPDDWQRIWPEWKPSEQNGIVDRAASSDDTQGDAGGEVDPEEGA